MSLLIINIAGLVQVRAADLDYVRGNSMQELPEMLNAWCYIENDKIIDFGEMDQCPYLNLAAQIIDATDQYVLPSFCDSHTHIVFAASRHEEFVDKIKGMSYEEIAKRGGGILNSAKKISETDHEKLVELAYNRIIECINTGTGAIEIKSGYGLTTANELKMLRVIKELKAISPIPIKSTFLGAHTYPLHYKNNHERYIQELVNDMLPIIVEEGLADYVDAFCEEGFFSPSECDIIFDTATKLGLVVKVHANQMTNSGGVQTGVKWDARSVDHLEQLGEEELELLSNSNTVATLLPGAAFYLRMNQAPARRLIEKNCIVSLATDFNPGSCPSGNMQLMIAIACISMKMLPAEAINAATLNAAFAMDCNRQLGKIAKGYKANLIITRKMESLAQMPYYFGKNHIDKMIVNGKIFDNNN